MLFHVKYDQPQNCKNCPLSSSCIEEERKKESFVQQPQHEYQTKYVRVAHIRAANIHTFIWFGYTDTLSPQFIKN